MNDAASEPEAVPSTVPVGASDAAWGELEQAAQSRAETKSKRFMAPKVPATCDDPRRVT
jgi:hypothetical protein